MATVIRFSRHGTKKKPYFRIVVQDHRSARDGRFIEHIGSFIPMKKDSFTVKRDRLEYWLSVGAKISSSVEHRLKKSTQKAAESPPPSSKPPKALKPKPNSELSA